jgi:hypothetical protein
MESDTLTFVSTGTLRFRNCARATEFEQPPCSDGHGTDCPEWYCRECGAAAFVGWSVDPRDLRRHTRRRSGSARVA